MARFDPAQSEKGLLVLLAVIVTLAPFAIDAYLPALPQIAADFAASEARIQYTIGAFLLGSGFGPLLTGPLSDAWGRRPIIIGGLAGFAALSLACAAAPSAEFLIVSRFFQAFLGSAALVAGRTLLADLFTGDKLSQKMSTITLMMGIAPMIAPLIGGAVSQTFGWRMIFVGLVILAAIAAATAFAKVPETLPTSVRSSLRLMSVLRGYASIFANPVAVMYLGAMACVSGAFFVYLSTAPFLLITHFGLTPMAFARFFAAGALLAVLANIANIFVVGHIGYRQTLLLQGLLMMATGMIAASAGFGLIGRWGIFAAGLAMMPLLHVVGNNSITGLLDQFETRKGTASALGLSMRFGTGALAVATVGAFNGPPDVRFGLILFVFSALSGICAQMAVRWDRA